MITLQKNMVGSPHSFPIRKNNLYQISLYRITWIN